MVDTIVSKARPRLKRQKPARPAEDAFTNPQMSLFQSFEPPEMVPARQSNAFALWDAMPLFHVSGKLMEQLREGGKYLPILRRQFGCDEQRYNLEIYPARLVDSNGEEKEYYPSRREELIADTLIKMMCEKGDGFYYEDGVLPRAGVCFTMYKLKAELRAAGHGCSTEALTRSLEILTRTVIEVSTLNGDAVCTTGLLSLSRVSKTQWLEDTDATCVALLNPLVADAVASGKYRQMNYDTLMSLKSQLARWIYRRICHNYRNASKVNTYTLKLSYVKRHTGFFEGKRLSAEIKIFIEAIDELVETNVVDPGYNRTNTADQRGVVRDITVVVRPTQEFIRDVISANARALRNAKQGALSKAPRGLQDLSEPMTEDSEVFIS